LIAIIDQGLIKSQAARESITTVRYVDINKRMVTATNGENFDFNLDKSCLDHSQTNAAVIM